MAEADALVDDFDMAVAAHVGEQPLELLHIAIDGAAEFDVAAIAPTDFVERLRTAADVKLPRKGIRFAAPIIIPRLGNRQVIDHSGDVVRDRLQRLALLRTARWHGRRQRLCRLGLFARGAGEEIGEPTRPSGVAGGRRRP